MKRITMPVSWIDLSIIGTTSLATAVMAAMKLYGYIDWSWWIVTSPMWAVALAILIMVILVAVLYIAVRIKKVYTRRKKVRMMQAEIDKKRIPLD